MSIPRKQRNLATVRTWLLAATASCSSTPISVARRCTIQDARLTVRIAEIHERFRGVYGSPRIHAELVLADGERLGRKRVERLMRAAGISGLVRRRRGRTTIRVPGVRVCEDLVDRAFAADRPDRLWVADITYLRTWQGWLYLAAVQDVFSRRIVGWSMAEHMRTELVLDALAMALEHRRPAPGLVHHSDQGSQYVSLGVRTDRQSGRDRPIDGKPRRLLR